MTDIVEDIRAAYADTNGPWGRTHYDGCYTNHALCAIGALLDLVAEMRDEDDRTAKYVAQLGEIVRMQSARIARLETEVARA